MLISTSCYTVKNNGVNTPPQMAATFLHLNTPLFRCIALNTLKIVRWKMKNTSGAVGATGA
jgi:hypothetical protein